MVNVSSEADKEWCLSWAAGTVDNSYKSADDNEVSEGCDARMIDLRKEREQNKTTGQWVKLLRLSAKGVLKFAYHRAHGDGSLPLSIFPALPLLTLLNILRLILPIPKPRLHQSLL